MYTLKQYRLQIILGVAAVVAVILTIALLSSGKNANGLTITAVSGSVSINGELESASNGTKLNEGDVVTVGEKGFCTITYKGKKNSENNYMILGQNSQLVITDDFTGKNDGEVFLKKGSLFCNFREADNPAIDIKTANAAVYFAGTVSKVSYEPLDETQQEFYTDIFTFMGNSRVQLFDLTGGKVNEPEWLLQK